MALEYNIKIYEKNLITSVKPDMLVETAKLSENLDSGVMSMPRLTRKSAFKRFSRVNIEIKEDSLVKRNVDYLVFGSKVEIAQRGGVNRYNHTITLIEPTKWLEKFPIGSLTFTQPLEGTRYTMADVLERLRILAPMVRQDKIEQTRLFDYDYSLLNTAGTVEAPQIFIDKANLREALFQVFRVFDAVPKMYFDNLSKKWVVYAEYFDDRLLEIDIEEGVIDYMNESEGENFAQGLESFNENVVPSKENDSVFEGSITDFISYRSDEIIVGEGNRKLILSNSIESIKKFTAIVTNEVNIYEVDLSNYLYEKDIYDSLDFKGFSGKEYALYYRYKQNTIEGFSEAFDIFGTTPAINNILTHALQEQFSEIISNQNINQVVFKIEYVPFIETLRTTQYRKYKKPYELADDMFDDYSAIIYNSQERLKDLYSMSKNLYGVIQRTGVETATITKKNYTLSRYNALTNQGGLYANGDYTKENFVLATTELVYYPNHIVVRYEFNKNFNRVSQFIALDREYRPYEISLTGRNLTLKRDIILPMAFVSIDYKGETTDTALENEFMKTFKQPSVELPYTIANLKQTDILAYKKEGVFKPIMPLAEKNTIKFKVDFQDTKLAGKEVNKTTVGLATNYTQKGVFYTDNEGFIKYLEIGLSREQWLETETFNLVSANQKIANMRVIADDIPNTMSYYTQNQDIYYSGFKIRVVHNGIIYHAVFVPFADTTGDLPYGFQGEYYYVNSGDLAGQLYYYTNGVMTFKGNTTHKENNNRFDLPRFRIEKDGAEILGVEMVLPIIIQQDIVNNIIVGDHLTKQNVLLKGKESGSLYFKGSSVRFNENITNYFNPFGEKVKLLDENVIGNKIIVPYEIYNNYDYYALINADGDLFLAVNQKGLDGIKTTIDEIYFNFIDLLGQARSEFDKIIEAGIYLNIGLFVETDLQTPYELIASEKEFEIDFVVDTALLKLFNLIANETIYLNFETQTSLKTPTNIISNEEIKVDFSVVTNLKTPTDIISPSEEVEIDLMVQTSLKSPTEIIDSSEEVNVSFTVETMLQLPTEVVVNEEIKVDFSVVTQLIPLLFWGVISKQQFDSASSKFYSFDKITKPALPTLEGYEIGDVMQRIDYVFEETNVSFYNSALTKIGLTGFSIPKPVAAASIYPIFELAYTSAQIFNYIKITTDSTCIELTDSNDNSKTYWKIITDRDYWRVRY